MQYKISQLYASRESQLETSFTASMSLWGNFCCWCKLRLLSKQKTISMKKLPSCKRTEQNNNTNWIKAAESWTKPITWSIEGKLQGTESNQWKYPLRHQVADSWAKTITSSIELKQQKVWQTQCQDRMISSCKKLSQSNNKSYWNQVANRGSTAQLRLSTAQHSIAQQSIARHCTAQQSKAQHSTAQQSTVQKSPAQHSKSPTKHWITQQITAQQSTDQSITTQQGTTQNNTAQ